MFLDAAVLAELWGRGGETIGRIFIGDSGDQLKEDVSTINTP